MATDSISLSAVHPDARPFYKLKARIEAMDLEVLRSADTQSAQPFFVRDRSSDTLLSPSGMSLADLEKFCDESETQAKLDAEEDAAETRTVTLALTRQPIPANRRAGGNDWDTATLELERVTNLADLIEKLIEDEGPEVGTRLGQLVTPVSLLRMELDYLATAIHALHENWTDPNEPAESTLDDGPVLGDGDESLPPEFEPAKALYHRLIDEGDAISTEKLISYLERPGHIGVVKMGADEFCVLESNLSRHGLSSVYAEQRLAWILRKVETEGAAA